MNSGSKLSYYINRSKSIDNNRFDKQICVAILGSFTINGLAETLRVKCADKMIYCKTYVPGYDQYNQDILNVDSDLYKFSPDVSFLILDTRSLLKNLFYSPYSVSAIDRKYYIEERANELLNLVSTFTKRSDSKLIITNFSIPTYSPYGIYETKTEYGIQDMVRDLNSRLSNAISSESSVYVYDFNSFVTRHGETNIFDYRQYLVGDIKIALNYIPYLAEDFMGYIKPILGMNRKCIVLDLDNTLWGGVVGEDGFEGIQLGQKATGLAFVEFQRCLLSFYQRGILLAINSRNNPEDALKVIRDHPYMILREENFVSLKINWDDKISNIREIAEELNIGLDSMVYFDDDPINREVMARAIPDVLTVDLPNDPSLYALTLMDLNDFNVLTITEEDIRRSQMYLQRRERNQLEKKLASNLDEYLLELCIRVKIKNADKFTIPRISQLTLKTNQFNLTTRRYQEEEIERYCLDINMLVGCAQVEDKFGDNGITAAFIVKKDTPCQWTIDTFLLSCRVMGRGVEHAIMAFIVSEAKKEAVTTLRGQYISTKKNKPCENFLPDSGFKKEEGEYWTYSPDIPPKMPKHLEVIAES